MNRIVIFLCAVGVAGCSAQAGSFEIPRQLATPKKIDCTIQAQTTDDDGKAVLRAIKTQCVQELYRDHCTKIAALLTECAKTRSVEECRQPAMDLCFGEVE